MQGQLKAILLRGFEAVRDLTSEIRTLRLEVVHLRETIATSRRNVEDAPSAVHAVGTPSRRFSEEAVTRGHGRPR